MGEYIPAGIQFGGRLKDEFVDELIGLLNDKYLREGYCSEPEPDNLGGEFAASDVNFGNLDELEDFGRVHGLHYKYWFDSGPEWDAASVRYFPQTGERIELRGSDAPLLSEREIRSLGSYEAVLGFFQRFREPMPPLEIVP